MAQFFLNFGYSPRDELWFPKKKLKAIWFSPPDRLQGTNGSGINGPLPRIFISELLVDEMSHQAQVFMYVMVDFFFNLFCKRVLTYESPCLSIICCS